MEFVWCFGFILLYSARLSNVSESGIGKFCYSSYVELSVLANLGFIFVSNQDAILVSLILLVILLTLVILLIILLVFSPDQNEFLLSIG